MRSRKIFSIFVTLIMLVASFSVVTFAADENTSGDDTKTQAD